MGGLLLRWLFLTLVVLAVPYVVTGVEVDGFGTALAAAAVLGVLNIVVKPFFVILTLPFTVLTLGLFLLVINALMFHMAAAFVHGLTVDSFWASFFAGLVISFFSWISQVTFQKDSGKTRIVIQRSGGRRTERDVTPRG